MLLNSWKGTWTPKIWHRTPMLYFKCVYSPTLLQWSFRSTKTYRGFRFQANMTLNLKVVWIEHIMSISRTLQFFQLVNGKFIIGQMALLFKMFTSLYENSMIGNPLAVMFYNRSISYVSFEIHWNMCFYITRDNLDIILYNKMTGKC